MKVIDLLNKIANGEDVPKRVKVLDMSALPEFQTIIWNEDIELYEYCDGFDFDIVLDKYHLNHEIEIIEDTPKEEIQVLSRWYPPKADKKIEKLDIINVDYYKNKGGISTEEIILDIKTLKNYINEIIDRLDGDDNGS